MHVLLRVRYLDTFLPDPPVDRQQHPVRGQAPLFRVLDPPHQLEIDRTLAEGAHAHARRRQIEDHVLFARDFLQDFDHPLGLGAVRHADRHPDAVLHRRATAFVGDFRVAHHRVRDRDLHVIAGQQARRAHAQLGHHAALAGVQDNVVTELVGRIRDDGHTGNQVGQGIFGGKTDRDADHAGRGQPGRTVDAPQQHEQPHRHREQEQLDTHFEQRPRARLEHLEPVHVA